MPSEHWRVSLQPRMENLVCTNPRALSDSGRIKWWLANGRTVTSSINYRVKLTLVYLNGTVHTILELSGGGYKVYVYLLKHSISVFPPIFTFSSAPPCSPISSPGPIKFIPPLLSPSISYVPYHVINACMRIIFAISQLLLFEWDDFFNQIKVSRWKRKRLNVFIGITLQKWYNPYQKVIKAKSCHSRLQVLEGSSQWEEAKAVQVLIGNLLWECSRGYSWIIVIVKLD